MTVRPARILDKGPTHVHVDGSIDVWETDAMKCRSCANPLQHVFVDLGDQPPANRYLSEAQLSDPRNEPLFRLKVLVCDQCWLVQLADSNRSEDIFTPDYAYFSSYVKSWVDHAARYVDTVVDRFDLGSGSLAVEIASNDGYLLQHFVQAGVPCLGIDPAAKAAEAAEVKGVRTVVDFFGSESAFRLANEHGPADLVIGNNVLAHVPDVNDFVAGIAPLLAPGGVVTMEFPHLESLLAEAQFDTIYDEHFSFFSFGAVGEIFARHGLSMFDVEKLPTHGGSLRIYAQHAGSGPHEETTAVQALLDGETSAGLFRLETYRGFESRVTRIREDFRSFVAAEKEKGHRIAAFGAAAKGNTFLNTCGIGHETIEFVVDDTPMKQGKYLPGSHIPVVSEARLRESRPDVVLILPWNVKDDVRRKLAYTAEWGAKLVTCIPDLEIT